MKWITREKVKVDRVACPWLIRKFIDADAEFVFLPRDTNWESIREGVVYDVPGCELGHHGEGVSFDSIIKVWLVRSGARASGADCPRRRLASNRSAPGRRRASLGRP